MSQADFPKNPVISFSVLRAKKVLKSKDFRTFSCILGVKKFGEKLCEFAEKRLTHNRIAPSGQVRIFQNTMYNKSENLRKFQNF